MARARLHAFTAKRVRELALGPGACWASLGTCVASAELVEHLLLGSTWAAGGCSVRDRGLLLLLLLLSLLLLLGVLRCTERI